jgi:hypothetical protein
LLGLGLLGLGLGLLGPGLLALLQAAEALPPYQLCHGVVLPRAAGRCCCCCCCCCYLLQEVTRGLSHNELLGVVRLLVQSIAN